MTYQYHDESIVKILPENTIFVFGSNMTGDHNSGAAKTALEHFGAMKGSGRGWAGQSFAIPTLNEHLQQMPLSQIQHYIDDFKIYTKNHPQNQYFITSIGCGITGYQIEEIAPMFKGISNNVIFPASFRPFVERTLPKLNQNFLHSFFNFGIISQAIENDAIINTLELSDNEKSVAKIILNTQMFPTDSNGRDRVFEIKDILHVLNGKTFDLLDQADDALFFGGVILALFELYHINEQDFANAWHGKEDITPPRPAHRARK